MADETWLERAQHAVGGYGMPSENDSVVVTEVEAARDGLRAVIIGQSYEDRINVFEAAIRAEGRGALDDVALGAALHNLKAQVVRESWPDGWEPVLLVDVQREYAAILAQREPAEEGK